MSIEQVHQQFLKSTGICTDSRTDPDGSLFYALKGERFDGNIYVEEALDKGCMLAVTERKDLEGLERVLVVPSVLEHLQQLARYHRMHEAPKVLAITGSNGKTTTKELLAAVLSTKYKLIATRGNLNNHIGVPLTLLRIKGEQLAIVEMGANHPGEIALLAGIACPDVGIITNVGKAHLEGFGSLQGVLEAKSELYAYLAEHGGKALVDGGDRVLLKKAGETAVSREVIAPGGDLPVGVRLLRQTPYLELELVLGGEVHAISSRLVGAYNLQNILFAAAAGLYFDIPNDSITRAISNYIPDNQRSQMIEGGRNTLVVDSYNANPSSMKESIGSMLNYSGSPLMLILGDMAELGASTEEEHRQLVQWIATLDVERVLLVGPNFFQVCEPSEKITVFRGKNELEGYLRQEPPEGYHILLKGSRIMELEGLIPVLKNI